VPKRNGARLVSLHRLPEGYKRSQFAYHR
jgi:hypothetical protein